MAQLFAGLDNQFEVWVIFYLRPQLQWIPSAWKQWGLKKGVPLSDFFLSVSMPTDHGSDEGSTVGKAVYPQPGSMSDFLFQNC
jgi:hypothetical protein